MCRFSLIVIFQTIWHAAILSFDTFLTTKGLCFPRRQLVRELKTRVFLHHQSVLTRRASVFLQRRFHWLRGTGLVAWHQDLWQPLKIACSSIPDLATDRGRKDETCWRSPPSWYTHARLRHVIGIFRRPQPWGGRREVPPHGYATTVAASRPTSLWVLICFPLPENGIGFRLPCLHSADVLTATFYRWKRPVTAGIVHSSAVFCSFVKELVFYASFRSSAWFYCPEGNACGASLRTASLPQTLPSVCNSRTLVCPTMPSSVGRLHIVMGTSLSAEWGVQFLYLLLRLHPRFISLQKVIYNLDVICEHSYFSSTRWKSGFQKEACCRSGSCLFFLKDGSRPYYGFFMDSLAITCHF